MWIFVIGLVIVLVLVGLATRRSEGLYGLDENGPGGYSGLRRILEGGGASVSAIDLADVRPGRVDSVLVVGATALTSSQSSDLSDLARRGIHVVLTGVPGGQRDFGDFSNSAVVTVRPDNCSIPVLSSAGLGELDTAQLAPVARTESDRVCFAAEGGAHVVQDSSGRYTVSGPELFVNDVMRAKDQEAFEVKAPQPDNAVVAQLLLAPRGNERIGVVTVRGALTGSDRSVFSFIPRGVQLALAQLVVAGVLYAVIRWRRFGRVVDERLPVELAGSELVSARGSLMARRRDPAHAAELLRRHMIGELAAALGLGPHDPPDLLAQILAARTGRDPAEVLAVLVTRPVADDAAFVQLVQEIDSLRGALT
jgi:hypothetical protein